MTAEPHDGAPRGVVALGSGRYAVADGGRTRLAYGVAEGDRIWIFLEGRTFLVGGPKPPAARRGPEDQASLAAPMPATVVSVRVRAGDRVSRGDVLLTLEAMKMELPVRAPRDGVVAGVACRPGDLVQPGVPLVELE
jgi:acetyl/propionyl-CoA carboxylase alpha subunit